jgi:hypothetical protein
MTVSRFYLSSYGYIVDRDSDTRVARIKERDGWRLRGERMCSALEITPASMATLLDLWQDELEAGPP